MRRLIGWSFVSLLVWTTVALAQDPAPACEAQVETLYSDLLKERLIYEVPGGSWTQHLTALATQLRVTKDTALMQSQLVQQRVEEVAIQKELERQRRQELAATMQQVMTLQARIKELEASQGQAPQAQK